MIQFAITPKTDMWANDYARDMKRKLVGDSMDALDRVVGQFDPTKTYEWVVKNKRHPNRYDSINLNDISAYIGKIKALYKELLTKYPSGFSQIIQDFEQIIGKDHINCKIVTNHNTGVEGKSLANRIVDAMKYNSVRDKIYPKNARQMKIKTCVYCNANYAISDNKGEGYFDLDHWKPKTLYPYLCVAFYNLQISCAPCNRRKSNSDLEFFQLWNDQIRTNKEVFRFHLDRADISRYWITNLVEELDIRLKNVNPADTVLLNNTENQLHISTRYKEHRDVAEEVLWRAKAYSEGYWTSFENALNTLGISQEDKRRYLMGTYVQPGDIYMRPLAKMAQDVAKAAGIRL